jgi:hypothetical protein
MFEAFINAWHDVISEKDIVSVFLHAGIVQIDLSKSFASGLLRKGERPPGFEEFQPDEFSCQCLTMPYQIDTLKQRKSLIFPETDEKITDPKRQWPCAQQRVQRMYQFWTTVLLHLASKCSLVEARLRRIDPITKPQHSLWHIDGTQFHQEIRGWSAEFREQ